MKRAVGFEVRACSLEVEPVGCNEVYDVGCTEDLLDNFIWDARHRAADPSGLGALANSSGRERM